MRGCLEGVVCDLRARGGTRVAQWENSGGILTCAFYVPSGVFNAEGIWDLDVPTGSTFADW